MEFQQSGRGIGFALAGAFFYGFNITFAKISSELGVQGPMIVAERVLVMIAIGLCFAALSRSALRIASGEVMPMILLGLGSMGVSIGYLSSVAFIPITVAAVIFYTFPILIVIASPFVDGKKLTPTMLGIVALAFIGVVLVLGMAGGDLDLRGVALALLASVSAAMQFFAGTRCRVTSNAAKIVVTQAIVLPGALASVWATGGLFSIETQVTAAVPIWLTIGGFVLGFVFQILALARISATVAGLVFCLEPVVAAITSAIVLGERLQMVQYFGGFLVIVAIASTMVAERQAAQ